MTTAELIIGHSTDDAAERKKEVHKIFWALLAALCIHLLIGYSLAVFGGLLYSPFSVKEEEKPVELTFVDLAPVAAPTPKELPFMETSRSRESIEEPKRKDFQSNANSIAASELPASGQEDLPSQAGKDGRAIEFENQDYARPIEGAQPQPSVAEEKSRVPEATVQATPITTSEQFALLTSTPRPTPPPASSAKPGQEYKRALTKVRVAGNVANPGASSVNATNTVLGQYTKAVWNLIVMQASSYFNTRGENSAIGSLDVEFVIEPKGHVKNVTVVKNSSNEVFANIMLQAITDSHLPPFPKELVSTYPEGFEFDAGFDLIPDNAVTLPR